MSRLLHRSKSTKELKTKIIQCDDEVPSVSINTPPLPNTPKKLLRKRAGTNSEYHLSPSKSTADMKVMIRNGVVVASSPLPSDRNSSVTSFGPKPIFPSPFGGPPFSSYSTASAANSISNLESPSVGCIGVAIGSPTVELNSYFEGTQTTDLSGNGPIPSFYLPAEPFDIKGDYDHNAHRAQQEGKTGWRKLFGRNLFGGKKGMSPPNAASPLQTQVPIQQIPTPQMQLPPTPVMTPGHISTPQRGYATMASQPIRVERKPVAARVKKDEPNEVVDWNSQKPRAQRTPTPPTPALTVSASSPNLLDVDIPSTEMERYSIMFGAFFAKANGETPVTAPAPKASLYERRKSRDVLSNKEPPPRLVLEPLLKRHATTAGRITPTPNHFTTASSPEIFGITTTCAGAHTTGDVSTEGAQKPNRRLGRSNTTAALNRDPRPGPGFVVISNTPENADTFPLTAHEFFDSVSNRKLGPFTATEINIGRGDSRARSGSEVSKVSAESSSISTPHGSFDDNDAWYPHKKIDDPHSNTVVLRSTNVTGSPAVNDLNDASWELVPAGTSPQPAAQPENDQKAVMAAVELSIQRQISVSQRQLLIPVVKPRERKVGQPLPQSVKRVASAGQLRR